jgi:transcriptional regulator with XRE-family HTH domain
MDIKTIMKRQGWTMDKIAEKMGKTQSNVSQIINSQTPTLSKLREIAGIIGCEWWEFFLDEIDPVKFQQARERGGMPSAQPTQSPGVFVCPHCGAGVSFGAFVVSKPAKEEKHDQD